MLPCRSRQSLDLPHGVRDDATAMVAAANEGVTQFLRDVLLFDLEVRPDGEGPINPGCVAAAQTYRRELDAAQTRAALNEILAEARI